MRKPFKNISINVPLCAFCTIFLLTACAAAAQSAPSAPPANGRLNVVAALGLGESVRIEIMQLDLEDMDPEVDYFPIANITNLAEVEEVVFLLNNDLQETPAVFCMPEYRIRFWMEDGTQIDLDFSCEDAEFITGSQPAFSGRYFTPPGKFTGLIRSYFGDSAEEAPSRINLLKAAEFTDVVSIEIYQQNSAENSAEVDLVLVIEDIEVIEEFMLALSGDYALQPQARCPVNYFITFSLDDGRSVTWGYMCSGDHSGILRGDQAYFFGQDLHLSSDFVELFEDLVSP